MTREFFAPERKRWIAPSTPLLQRLDVAIEFLEISEGVIAPITLWTKRTVLNFARSCFSSS